jgi:twitching motility protein PilJ
MNAPLPVSSSTPTGHIRRASGSFLSTRTTLYVLLGLILLATGGVLGAVLIANRAQQDDGPVINRAGRQRMLSQKITKDLLLLRTTDAAQRAPIFKRLETAYGDLVKAHRGLIDGDAELGLPGTPAGSPLREKMDVADRFFSEMSPLIAQALDRTTAEDLRQADIRLIALPDRSSTAGATVSLNEQFLKAMDDATFAFDADAKTRSGQLRTLALVGGALVVLMTVIATLFSRRLGHALEDGERALAEADHATAELVRLNNELQNGIVALERAVASAAQGDLRVRAQVGNGPLVSLATDLDGMLDALAGLVTHVQRQVAQTDLVTAQLASISGRVADGADRQAERLMSAQAALEAINLGLAQASASAAEAAAAARRTRESAEGGDALVQQAVGGMESVRGQVQDGARQMKSLGDRSMEITGIVTTIGEITEQTNMLALNATIEAARAGEAGRGFGVVANEVGKLAERASIASREIGQLVNAIQDETQDAVDRFENQTRAVEGETATVGRAGTALRDIRTLSSQSAELADRITAIAARQADAGRSVVGTMQGLNDISMQTLRDADEARELGGKLAVVGTELRNAVSRFQV